MNTAESGWHEWPVCGRCGRPRQTTCPACGRSGCDFPLADYQAMAAPQHATRGLARDVPARAAAHHAWLLCTQCDEAFQPQFYRICAACGCDAGDGFQAAPAPTTRVPRRVLLAAYGVLAIVTLVLVYLWMVLRLR